MVQLRNKRGQVPTELAGLEQNEVTLVPVLPNINMKIEENGDIYAVDNLIVSLEACLQPVVDHMEHSATELGASSRPPTQNWCCILRVEKRSSELNRNITSPTQVTFATAGVRLATAGVRLAILPLQDVGRYSLLDFVRTEPAVKKMPAAHVRKRRRKLHIVRPTGLCARTRRKRAVLCSIAATRGVNTPTFLLRLKLNGSRTFAAEDKRQNTPQTAPLRSEILLTLQAFWRVKLWPKRITNGPLSLLGQCTSNLP